MTELLTQYGDIFMVWWDGACGEGPNGKKQEYDFDAWKALVRKYQPNAVIFHDKGPDVRWVGNEAGKGRFAEWAVVPGELCPNAEVQTGPGPMAGDLSFLYNTLPDLGSLAGAMTSKGLCFCPSEVDMSIRPGWYYHPEEQPHSLERLMDTYIASVGGNACFHLNVPPMPNGLFDPRDVKRLEELGEALRAAFGHPLPGSVQKIPFGGETQACFEITLEAESDISYLMLKEDIAKGQRVESFCLQVLQDGVWSLATGGATIGHKRIVKLPEGFRAQKLRVVIAAARDIPEIKEIAVY